MFVQWHFAGVTLAILPKSLGHAISLQLVHTRDFCHRVRLYMFRIHNSRLEPFLRDVYTPADLARLDQFLHSAGTFHFPALTNGLYPAAHLAEGDPSGYANVWVRDNVHIAHALWLDGQTARAVQTVHALVAFMRSQLPRIARVLDDPGVAHDPQQRPHIRFAGHRLEELDERWAHAQNDALGYLLWLAARMMAAGALRWNAELAEVLTALALFLERIDFATDEDSGHWEETRKQNASSVGTALAGLRALRQVIQQPTSDNCWCFHGQTLSAARLDAMIDAGQQALAKLVPHECRDPHPLKRRAADAALLFLIYPLQVVDETSADAIMELVERDLVGEIGIRRYLGDSYWCADYKQKFAPEERSADFSEHQGDRDALLRTGEEAQWCLFDPILSTICGERWRATSERRWLDEQTRYFHRALGHLTADDSPFGGLRCPESYYLEQGRYVPVDQTPLLWTQANLLIALRMMQRSANRID